jgi:hypothetical protein
MQEKTLPREELELLAHLVDDQAAKESFDRLRLFINSDLFSKFDGGFFTLSIAAAVTNLKFQHRLGFIPLDIFQTSKIGAGAVTFNYSLFDDENLDITTTGACDLRFVAGSFVVDR